MMGFNVESDVEAASKVTCDLTPYRERDKRAKQQQQQGATRTTPQKQQQSTPRHNTVRIEDRKVTEVKFNDEQRDTVTRSVSLLL